MLDHPGGHSRCTVRVFSRLGHVWALHKSRSAVKIVEGECFGANPELHGLLSGYLQASYELRAFHSFSSITFKSNNKLINFT